MVEAVAERVSLFSARRDEDVIAPVRAFKLIRLLQVVAVGSLHLVARLQVSELHLKQAVYHLPHIHQPTPVAFVLYALRSERFLDLIQLAHLWRSLYILDVSGLDCLPSCLLLQSCQLVRHLAGIYPLTPELPWFPSAGVLISSCSTLPGGVCLC